MNYIDKQIDVGTRMFDKIFYKQYGIHVFQSFHALNSRLLASKETFKLASLMVNSIEYYPELYGYKLDEFKLSNNGHFMLTNMDRGNPFEVHIPKTWRYVNGIDLLAFQADMLESLSYYPDNQHKMYTRFLSGYFKVRCIELWAPGSLKLIPVKWDILKRMCASLDESVTFYRTTHVSVDDALRTLAQHLKAKYRSSLTQFETSMLNLITHKFSASQAQRSIEKMKLQPIEQHHDNHEHENKNAKVDRITREILKQPDTIRAVKKAVRQCLSDSKNPGYGTI